MWHHLPCRIMCVGCRMWSVSRGTHLLTCCHLRQTSCTSWLWSCWRLVLLRQLCAPRLLLWVPLASGWGGRVSVRSSCVTFSRGPRRRPARLPSCASTMSRGRQLWPPCRRRFGRWVRSRQRCSCRWLLWASCSCCGQAGPTLSSQSRWRVPIYRARGWYFSRWTTSVTRLRHRFGCGFLMIGCPLFRPCWRRAARALISWVAGLLLVLGCLIRPFSCLWAGTRLVWWCLMICGIFSQLCTASLRAPALGYWRWVAGRQRPPSGSPMSRNPSP